MKMSWSLLLTVGVVVSLLWCAYSASTLYKDWDLGPVVLEYGSVVVPLLWYAYRLHVLISR